MTSAFSEIMFDCIIIEVIQKLEKLEVILGCLEVTDFLPPFFEFFTVFDAL